MTAKSIQQAVNEVLSGEPGYQAATDAEFEDLLWAGFSDSGAEGRYWIINPIDGLEGFENLRQYGISLALLDDGKAQYGVLARGDAKVLLMGGQDDIWDHAAGMLIAQESGLLVTNGTGAAMDASCGTKLNCDRGVVATHRSMHANAVKEVTGTITFKTQQRWISAIIDSGTASSSALQLAAENYVAGNYHGFVEQLTEAADKSKHKLSIKRAKHLVSILCEGPVAVQFAVAQQSISRAEIEALLQLTCETASCLTATSLGFKDEDACVYDEFMHESSDVRNW